MIASVAYLFAHFFVCMGVKSRVFFVPFVYEQYSPLLTFRFLDWYDFLLYSYPPRHHRPQTENNKASTTSWVTAMTAECAQEREREVSPAHNSPSHENSNTSSQKH